MSVLWNIREKAIKKVVWKNAFKLHCVNGAHKVKVVYHFVCAELGDMKIIEFVYDKNPFRCKCILVHEMQFIFAKEIVCTEISFRQFFSSSLSFVLMCANEYYDIWVVLLNGMKIFSDVTFVTRFNTNCIFLVEFLRFFLEFISLDFEIIVPKKSNIIKWISNLANHHPMDTMEDRHRRSKWISMGIQV